MDTLTINPDVQANPEEILQAFRNVYSLVETKNRLAEWLEVALTTDNMPFDDSKSREELFRFYHNLVNVCEAVWVLDKN